MLTKLHLLLFGILKMSLTRNRRKPPLSLEKIMSDEEMIQLICMLSELDEFKRKQIAILLMSTTLNPLSVEEVAGFMVGIAEEKNNG